MVLTVCFLERRKVLSMYKLYDGRSCDIKYHVDDTPILVRLIFKTHLFYWFCYVVVIALLLVPN